MFGLKRSGGGKEMVMVVPLSSCSISGYTFSRFANMCFFIAIEVALKQLGVHFKLNLKTHTFRLSMTTQFKSIWERFNLIVFLGRTQRKNL